MLACERQRALRPSPELPPPPPLPLPSRAPAPAPVTTAAADGPSRWVNFADLPGGTSKPEIMQWGCATMGLERDKLTEDDNGKFIIKSIEGEGNRFVMVLIFRQKVTTHSIEIDTTDGSDSKINKKVYMPFASIDEMVTKLSTDPLPPKWPIKLLFGRDGQAGEMASSEPLELEI